MFEAAVEMVLQHEGGYVYDARDPGGETNYGISKRAYPEINIKELTRDDAKRIYKADYWDVVRAGEMPEPIGIAVFDMAVNAGAGTAIRLLQRVVDVADDGIIGPVTIAAVINKDPHWLAVRYAAERISYYAALSGWQRFGRGWSARVIKTAIVGLAG